LLGPFAQSAQALRKTGLSLGAIGFLNASADLLEVFAQRVGCSVADFQEGVQETQDDGDVGKQALPSALGGGPTIGIDRLGGIARSASSSSRRSSAKVGRAR
jgi:hypothetical protein